jgi:cytidyltransferase-like protein
MGGAAGHMAHPFDLGSVRTGNDLLDFFNKAKEHLETEGAGAVKIDGVNVSFKVVEIDGQHEFAVDRGSLKEIDISGITMSRVDQRFPEGHGMRPAIKTLLTILNKALPAIKPQLQELGMWDNPSMFLNTEYVTGTTNVTDYDENFLAIHGLNQFYEKVAKSGASKGNVRPGAERPDGVKAPSREVTYDPEIMETLIEKLNPIAGELGFKVYGSVPTTRAEETDIDFSSTLSEPLTINISDGREITKSLGDWLSSAQNPDYDSLKVRVGDKMVTRHPLHKELYKALAVDGVPVVSLVDQADAERAINGALFMHATRMLGNDVLRGLTSPMGDLMSHEGVVLRDEEKFGPNPVKITGEFILGNLGGGFGGSVNENEDEDDDPVVDSDFSKTVAIVPGAFKPPHNGHLAMVRAYAAMADEVIVLISMPTKSGRKLPNGREITAEDSLKIWKLLVGGLDNVTVGVFNDPEIRSPISAAYAIAGAPRERESAALKVEPKISSIPPNSKIILGASTKGGDTARWNGAEKYIGGGPDGDLELLPPSETAVAPTTRPTGEPYSATDMRALLGAAETDEDAIEELEEFIGEDNVFNLLSILGLASPMQEMSSMGGGAVQGAVSANGGPWVNTTEIEDDNKEEKQRSKLVTRENKDLVTVEEVMKLIMERGILR